MPTEQVVHTSFMLKDKVAALWTDKAKREVFVNYLYLFLVQGANYLLPLITVPYIARTISPESFGKIAVVQAFVSYFTLVINYGFEFTSTREIAAHKDDKVKIQQVVRETFTAKAFLLGLCTVVFVFLTFFVPTIQQDAALYWVAFLVNIGFFLTPNWYLHGTGRLKVLAVLNLLIKVTFTVLIFGLVTSDKDTLLIPLSTSVANIVLGVAGVLWILRQDRIGFSFTSPVAAFKTLHSGSSIFLSTLAVNFYTTSNILLIGFLGDERSTANFTASNRLVTIIASIIIAPISLTLFPILARKMTTSVKEGVTIVHKLALWLGLGSALVSVVLFMLAQFIVSLLYGDQYIDTYLCLRIVSVIPFLVTVNNIYGTQGILNLKMDRAFLMVTLLGSGLSVGLNFLLIPLYQEYGTAWAWVTTEVFITLSFILLFVKKARQLQN